MQARIEVLQRRGQDTKQANSIQKNEMKSKDILWNENENVIKIQSKHFTNELKLT